MAWAVPYVLILLPLFAIKIADDNAWKLENLPFAFGMIFVIGLTFEVASRISIRCAYWAGVAISTITTLLIVLGNLAVGFAGSEKNQINVIFFAAPTFALIGSLAVKFRASALSIVMLCAAITQLGTGLIAYYHGHFTGPLSVTFTSLWLAASLCFKRSA